MEFLWGRKTGPERRPTWGRKIHICFRFLKSCCSLRLLSLSLHLANRLTTVMIFLHVNLNFFHPQQGKLSLTDELHWADGFIIVYDISDRASFAFAKALLYRIQESHIGACKKMVESTVFLVGNKQDLCHMREVGWDEGQKLAMDNKCQFCELSAAEHYQEVVAMFTKVLRSITSNLKAKEKRRPSGSKSMAKLINNVFGKRRKSV
uniref:small monomeric GTPase n=1 Tax=Pavo cristatus TaxID=9049 RepID=A0A8C9FU07_PAVCR